MALTKEEEDLVARARALWHLGDVDGAVLAIEDYLAAHPDRRAALATRPLDAPLPEEPPPPAREAAEPPDEPPPRSPMAKAFLASGVFVLLAAGGCGLVFSDAAQSVRPLGWLFFLIGWIGILGAPVALVVGVALGAAARVDRRKGERG